jgi:hypothetical protein
MIKPFPRWQASGEALNGPSQKQQFGCLRRPDGKIGEVAQRVCSLAAQRRTFRDKLEERQALRVSNQDPDWEDLGARISRLEPAGARRDAAAAQTRDPAAKLLELAKDLEAGWDAAD